MTDWIDNELSSIDRGDKRLDDRAAKLLENIVARPEASIPGASQGWAETQAGYRFLSNENVS